MYKEIRIYYGQNKERLLTFTIQKTAIAQRWAKMVSLETSGSGIRERERFTGFSVQPEKDLQRCIAEITRLIDEIKKIRKDVHFGNIDFSNVQAEVNRIHVNFADKHLLLDDFVKGERPHWTLLNIKLHEAECLLGSEFFIKKYGFSNARNTITFHQDVGTDLIAKTEFRGASLSEKFGTIYLGYSEVGRHIWEVCEAEDVNVPPEHIKPFNLMSADFVCWLGPDREQGVTTRKLSKMKSWFEKNQALFEKNLHWSQEELRIGLIPVADLILEDCRKETCLELQDTLNSLKYVHSIEVT